MSKRLLNILSYLGMALVFAAVAVRLLGWTNALPVSPAIDRYALYAVWVGFALVLIYTIIQIAQSNRRDVRYGALAGFSVLVVLGILVAVNYLSARQNKRWDLTENRQYSLADQTVQLLKGLTAPVKILVFDQAVNFDRFRPRLTEYAYQSSQVEVEYVDADRNPVRARQYEIDTYPTFVIEYMGRTERVTSDGEQELTNALIKVLNPQSKKVYFLAGHGEKDTADTDRVGYSAISDALKRDNFEFDKLILAQTNEIPSDATAIIVAGPRTDLLEQEVPLIREYLGKGGKLLALLDPSEDLKTPAPLPRLEGLLKEWGISPTESVVVDVSGRTSVATVPVAGPPYPGHAITNNFNLITMFPVARAIVPEMDVPNRTPQSFVQTAPRSWAEATLSQLDDPNTLAPEPDKGDLTGPVSIAVAVAVPTPAPEKPTPASDTGEGDTPPAGAEEEEKQPETRVAAIGDSDFASNGYLGVEGNRDLFMNTVNWLAQQENLISIRPREAADRRVTMTAAQRVSVFWMSIVLVPAVVFGAGIFTWWRRR